MILWHSDVVWCGEGLKIKSSLERCRRIELTLSGLELSLAGDSTRTMKRLNQGFRWPDHLDVSQVDNGSRGYLDVGRDKDLDTKIVNK